MEKPIMHIDEPGAWESAPGFKKRINWFDRCKSLERQLADAREDTERLDAIEAMGFTRIKWMPRQSKGTHPTLRQAIDTEMKGQNDE